MTKFATRHTGTETVVADTDGLVFEGIGEVVFSLGHSTDENADAFGGSKLVNIVSDTDHVGIETQRHFPAIGW